MQIKPLIAPTRLIMKIGVQNYDWHELFPKGILQFFLIAFFQIPSLNLSLIVIDVFTENLFTFCSQE